MIFYVQLLDDITSTREYSHVVSYLGYTQCENN